jgi:metal-responsive CopG/Arc/MetJ family transcriptional regulator
MDDTPKRGRPPLAIKSKKRSMTFPAGLYERLEKAAKREERPVSELVMEAVRRLLKEREELGPKVAARKVA